VAAFPVLLLLVLAAGGGGQPNPEVIQLLPLVIIVPALMLWARLMLITPATAAEAVGPVAVIRRSWELTRGHFWKLFVLLLLVLLVLGVVTGVGAFVGGLLVILVAGQPEPGSLPALLVILISVALHTLITVYVAPLHARIYRQLAGGERHDVFA
jgi:uncharacterized membrane protein